MLIICYVIRNDVYGAPQARVHGDTDLQADTRLRTVFACFTISIR